MKGTIKIYINFVDFEVSPCNLKKYIICINLKLTDLSTFPYYSLCDLKWKMCNKVLYSFRLQNHSINAP
jgi:hypothetical protein